jgi:hypothetical protein
MPTELPDIWDPPQAASIAAATTQPTTSRIELKGVAM